MDAWVLAVNSFLQRCAKIELKHRLGRRFALTHRSKRWGPCIGWKISFNEGDRFHKPNGQRTDFHKMKFQTNPIMTCIFLLAHIAFFPTRSNKSIWNVQVHFRYQHKRLTPRHTKAMPGHQWCWRRRNEPSSQPPAPNFGKRPVMKHDMHLKT